MSCLSVIIRRIGEMAASLTRVGGLTASVRRIGEMTARTERIGEMTATITRIGEMTCRIGLVCGTNLGINGGIIWANDGRLLTLENGFLISAQQ